MSSCPVRWPQSYGGPKVQSLFSTPPLSLLSSEKRKPGVEKRKRGCREEKMYFGTTVLLVDSCPHSRCPNDSCRRSCSVVIIKCITIEQLCESWCIDRTVMTTKSTHAASFVYFE